ncbi:Regulator of V-ATPase in vacuolar membrane protein 1 [Fusarium oxysporum f. sp. albedinis]|nr:Regulator of V-ATPase in vacuolar membrane protein 1 [Fusarium oxysporum f. sp. albedinis]
MDFRQNTIYLHDVLSPSTTKTLGLATTVAGDPIVASGEAGLDLLRLEGRETAIKGIVSRENKPQNASKEQ